MKKTVLLNVRSILLLIFIFSTTFVIAQSPQTFISSGTFTVPTGITSIQVEAWGADVDATGNPSTGGEACDGAYAKNSDLTVISDTTYTATVGTIGVGPTTTGVFKDGTTTTQANITWTGGYNGSITAPISLALHWLYKFDNYGNYYLNWVQIAETVPPRVDQGLTLKADGTASETQNYTFAGQPNIGSIPSNTAGDDQLLPIVDPNPSVLDAVAFITDTANSNSINGSTYFWKYYAKRWCSFICNRTYTATINTISMKKLSY